MTPDQEDAFYHAAGVHASALNFDLRLSAGLLLSVVAVYIVAGLLKLLESGQAQDHLRFFMYLLPACFEVPKIFQPFFCSD